MRPDELKSIVFESVIDAIAVSLDAQLHAVNKLRQLPAKDAIKKKVGKSQVDLVEDILKEQRAGLHINDIIARVESACGIKLDRESIVSALTKKVSKGDRFVRVRSNTFALKGEKV